MKPFLLLATREVDRAADNEYEAMLHFSGLEEGQLRRVRLEQGPLGPVDLDELSGIIVGGGPFNSSDVEKSDVQVRVEAEISSLLDRIVPRDFPFLGACYGIGTLGMHQGAVVDRSRPEPVGPLSVTLTPAGEADPVFAGVPRDFTAYGGHKEAMVTVPTSAVQLATSAACPVQAFRVGENAYATQFHPELDLEGVCTRIEVYKDAGYFPPSEAETLKELSRSVQVQHPMTVLRNFVARYRR